MDIYYSPEGSSETYKSQASSNRLTMTRSNGKVSIKADNITLVSTSSGSQKTISIDSREK